MTPYLWRLCCLSLAVLVVVQFLVGGLLRLTAPRVVRLAGRVDPSKAAALMLALRWLPSVAGWFAALGLCVPVYLRLEPLAGEEEVGVLCAGLAAWAVACHLFPIVRAVSNVVRSEVRLRLLVRDAEERAGLFVIQETSPAMALAGLFHSRVVVSREVLRLLTDDQMDVAQRHERAHQESRDNWKRLLLEAAPMDGSGSEIRTAWSRFSEWAADDRAAGGDAERSVALASALVSVARLGSFPECGFEASMLVSDGRELRTRVERLLEPSAAELRLRFPAMTFCAVGALVAGAIALVAQQPACAAVLHQLLEFLVD